MPETAAATVRSAATADAIPWWGSLKRAASAGHHPAALMAAGGRYYASRASASTVFRLGRGPCGGGLVRGLDLGRRFALPFVFDGRTCSCLIPATTLRIH